MKKESRRSQRVADVVRSVLSNLLLIEAHDPELKKVTLTEVGMSPDLRLARVFYSVLGDEADRERAALSLERATGYLRGEVGRRAGLRYAPELAFVPDRSLEQGARVEEILARVLPPKDEEP
jgi:ribosome-binding factor A